MSLRPLISRVLPIVSRRRKVEANASKHKAMSYGRVGSEINRLEREIREFSEKAEEIVVDEEKCGLRGFTPTSHALNIDVLKSP